MESIKGVLLLQIEALVRRFSYDFLSENEGNESLCHVLYRDENGTVMGTPLTFKIEVDEEKGNGVVIYYNQAGEFHRQKFSVFEEDGLLKILEYINERLSINRKWEF